jgi:hypothetical protein
VQQFANFAVAPAKALEPGNQPHAASDFRKVFSAEASLSGVPAENLAVAPANFVVLIWA